MEGACATMHGKPAAEANSSNKAYLACWVQLVRYSHIAAVTDSRLEHDPSSRNPPTWLALGVRPSLINRRAAHLAAAAALT